MATQLLRIVYIEAFLEPTKGRHLRASTLLARNKHHFDANSSSKNTVTMTTIHLSAEQFEGEGQAMHDPQ